jgi:hypothetical protein
MLGIADLWVALAYLLYIVSALFCLFWGILKRNKDDPAPESD